MREERSNKHQKGVILYVSKLNTNKKLNKQTNKHQKKLDNYKGILSNYTLTNWETWKKWTNLQKCASEQN